MKFLIYLCATASINLCLAFSPLFLNSESLEQGVKVNYTAVDGAQFGIKADYNGKTGTDNTAALQRAIDYCAKNKRTLLLPKGKILLNSYAKSPSAKAHANIIELRSNTLMSGRNSEIVVGRFFDDKPFVVFSGLTAVSISDFPRIDNIKISDLTINFNSAQVRMRSKYQLARGIELGHVVNAEVMNCIFTNGDITAAVISGNTNKNISKNVIIHHNRFINLVQTTLNIDHTSVYLNSSNSSIYNNTFTNTSTQGKLVACAGELHGSKTSFYNNYVQGYTRMNFVAATQIENHHLKTLRIYNNEAYITNAAIYLWTEKNTSITDLQIYNNKVYSSHVDGYSMLYNGTQGLLADAKVEANAVISGLVLKDNYSKIEKTIIRGRAVNFAYDKARVIKSLTQSNNVCEGCTDGVFYNAIFPSSN